MDQVKMSVNLPADLHEALTAEAKALGVTIADLLRDGARMYFEAKESRQPFVDVGIAQLVRMSTSGVWGFDADKFLKLAKERKLLGDGLWTDERLLLLKPTVEGATQGFIHNYGKEELLAMLSDGLGVDKVRLEGVMSADFVPSVEKPSEGWREPIDEFRDRLDRLEEEVGALLEESTVKAEDARKQKPSKEEAEEA